MDFYVKKIISVFSLFFWFSIMAYIDFTRIAASNTASNDVTHNRSHMEYMIQIYHTFVLFL